MSLLDQLPRDLDMDEVILAGDEIKLESGVVGMTLRECQVKHFNVVAARRPPPTTGVRLLNAEAEIKRLTAIILQASQPMDGIELVGRSTGSRVEFEGEKIWIKAEDVKVRLKLLRDALRPGIEFEFTEVTLKEPGHYYYYPDASPCHEFDQPKFVVVEKDAIDDGWLRCPKWAGTYIGPIIPPTKSTL